MLQLFTQDKHWSTNNFLSLLKLRMINLKIKILENNFPFRHAQKLN
jgi:hypothetical protein